jgi:protein-disulfide isomerase
MKSLLTLALVLCAAIPCIAQPAASPRNPEFKDTHLMKPPAGAKVAVYAFEDLECPACAYAFPIVQAACLKNGVPLVHRDFTWPFHSWSQNAAINARYLEDKVSSKLAVDYRHDVFAAQTRIASRDDLANFTRRWFQSHGQNMPFLIDPNGMFTKEVGADRAFGERIGVHVTPTFFVVSEKGCVNVVDPNRIDQTLQAALSHAATPVRRTPHQ